MKNILEKIVNDKKQSLELIKKDKSLDALEINIKNQNFFDFKEAIQKNNGISIISEIKKSTKPVLWLGNGLRGMDSEELRNIILNLFKVLS